MLVLAHQLRNALYRPLFNFIPINLETQFVDIYLAYTLIKNCGIIGWDVYCTSANIVTQKDKEKPLIHNHSKTQGDIGVHISEDLLHHDHAAV